MRIFDLGVFLFIMPGKVGINLNETVVAIVVAADTAAGTQFAAVNLSTQGGGQIWIDGFDGTIQFGTDGDIATLDNVTVQILKNVGPISPDININNQGIGNAVIKHWSDADGRQQRNVHREFTEPIILDSGYNYVVLCTFFNTAAITTADTIRLTVLGRNVSAQDVQNKNQMYGIPR